MTFNNNNTLNNLTLDSNFVYPKNRKEIGECISQFKKSSDVPKTREEIVDYIKLIKKPFLEERMKLKLERQSISSVSNTTVGRIPKNREEIGECIKQFKESSGTPKTRQEIVDYIKSIKRPFREERKRLRLERQESSTTSVQSNVEPVSTSASNTTTALRIPKNREEIGECIKQFKESSSTPKTRQEIVDHIQLIKKPFREERNNENKSIKSNHHRYYQRGNTNQKSQIEKSQDKIQKLTNKKLNLQNKIDLINVKIEFLSKSNQKTSTSAVDSSDSTLTSN